MEIVIFFILLTTVLYNLCVHITGLISSLVVNLWIWLEGKMR